MYCIVKENAKSPGLGQDGDVENAIGIVLFGQKIAGASMMVWKGKQAGYTLSNVSMTDGTTVKVY